MRATHLVHMTRTIGGSLLKGIVLTRSGSFGAMNSMG